MKSILCFVFLIGICHGVKREWTADDYPNPRTNPIACGRHPGKPSNVCDPNKIISTEAADYLDHILLSMPNDTMCPCSTHSCEDREHNKGYKMAIALVRKLKRPEGYEDSPDKRKGLATQFVIKLLRDQWINWGVCDELTIIVFSKEDGILMTLPGKTPRRKLTEDITHAIQSTLARFFRSTEGNIGQGLHYVVLNYRRVLDGEGYLPVMYANVPVDGASIATVSIVTNLLTTLLCWSLFY